MSKTNPKTYCSGSGSEDVYVLEARCTDNTPKVIGEKFILTEKWQQIPWMVVNGVCGQAGGGVGISVSPMVSPLARDHHMVNYEAAEAFAYRFLAELCAGDWGFGHYCTELRIVKIRMEYQYSATEVGVGEIINRTDRPRPVFRPREDVGDVPLSARVEKKVAKENVTPTPETPTEYDARQRANDPLTGDGAGNVLPVGEGGEGSEG